MIVYHATDEKGLQGIQNDGFVKANRLECCYFFSQLIDAVNYRLRCELPFIVRCEIKTKQVATSYHPMYAVGGVIKLKIGEVGKYIEVID